jgi:hypothetical protein
MKTVKLVCFFSCICLVFIAPILHILGYWLNFQFLSLNDIAFLLVLLLFSLYLLRKDTAEEADLVDK